MTLLNIPYIFFWNPITNHTFFWA